VTVSSDPSFLGTGWGFPPTFSRATRSVGTARDEEDIRQSLQVLLGTRVGERVMQPRYGCNLDRLVFEPIDTGLRTYLADLIRTAILYFEPRIILDDVTIEGDEPGGQVIVSIEFTIAATNTRHNLVYPFYRSESSTAPGSTDLGGTGS
jgi:phage baseplate assembly protein W